MLSKGNEGKFCRLDDLKSYTTQPTSENEQLERGQVAGEIRLRAPDWMSLDESDWKCFGPSTDSNSYSGNAAAGVRDRDVTLTSKGSLNRTGGGGVLKTSYSSSHMKIVS